METIGPKVTAVRDGCNDECCQSVASSPESSSVFGRLFTFCALHLFGFDCHRTKCLRRKFQQESSRDAWLQSFGLLRSKDMPEEIRELHLVVGYRPNPSSFTYCLKSLFYPTNETLNFWTHFIALFILAHRFYSIFLERLIGPMTAPQYYPLWLYAFGCCGMLVGSCVAHAFSCYSRNIRETCWFCDYASITLCCFGSTIAYHYYVCPFECIGISIKSYIPMMGIAAAIGHFLCCYSRFVKSKIKYAMRSSVFASQYIITFIPCSYMCFHDNDGNLSVLKNATSTVNSDLRCHIGMTSFGSTLALVTFFSFATVFFNVSKFPEKYFPGTFDIVGHSHQWLHVTIATALYWQTFLIERSLIDMHSLSPHRIVSADDLDITWWDSVGTAVAVVLVCVLICVFSTLKLPKEKQKSM